MAIVSWDGLHSFKLTAMRFAGEGGNHLIHQVVDIKQLHLHVAVVDLYGQVMGDVMAEGGYGTVVIGAAPLAEQIRETIDQHLGPGLLSIPEKQLLPRPLAPSILRVTETTGQGGLNGATQHDGTGIAFFAQRINQETCETEVTRHELLLILRAIDSRQIENEVAIPAPLA